MHLNAPERPDPKPPQTPLIRLGRMTAVVRCRGALASAGFLRLFYLGVLATRDFGARFGSGFTSWSVGGEGSDPKLLRGVAPGCLRKFCGFEITSSKATKVVTLGLLMLSRASYLCRTVKQGSSRILSKSHRAEAPPRLEHFTPKLLFQTRSFLAPFPHKKATTTMI